MTFALSQPESVDVTRGFLIDHMNCGRVKIDSSLKRLAELGYVRLRDNDLIIADLPVLNVDSLTPTNIFGVGIRTQAHLKLLIDALYIRVKKNNIGPSPNFGTDEKTKSSVIGPEERTNNLTKNTKKNKGFNPGSWQYELAVTGLRFFRSKNILSPSLRKFKDDELIQIWAKVFDDINRIDLYSEKEIAAVLRFIMYKDNFWIERANINSFGNLRRRRPVQDNPERLTTFDKMVNGYRKFKKTSATKDKRKTQPGTFE